VAADERAKFGHKRSAGIAGLAERLAYIRKFQARRSMLVWKIYGKRSTASTTTTSIRDDARRGHAELEG